MRLILSRKGYDSSAGGCPSPIFPNGELCSLPIPSKDELRLSEVRCNGRDLSQIVAQLSGDSDRAQSRVHLDPDLDFAARPRRQGWRPSFGQTGAAQAHLENQGTGAGDLFLFFGWFRRVEERDGVWRYQRGAADVHCLFGWLQVGMVCNLDRGDEAPAWAREHPHVRNAGLYRSKQSSNTLYVAAQELDLPIARELPGGGLFTRFAPSLQLTAMGYSRSVWRLPSCLEPQSEVAALTYHANPRRWRRDGDGLLLRSAGRGQEFVLDCDSYPGVFDWLSGIFEPLRESDPSRGLPAASPLSGRESLSLGAD